MLVLSRTQVESLLDLDALIDALADTLVDLSAGRTSVPPRTAAEVEGRDGLLLAMPGYVPSAGVLAAKLVSLFPRNAGGVLPTHQAVIVAFDPDNGAPIAFLDGTAITAARTGACSALSARLLARPDAGVLAVVGTGVQARSHARAMCRVRPIRQIRVAGRDPAKVRALAEELATELDDEREIAVHAMPSYRDALRDADIVAATTHTADPVVRREWLTPGAHVTSVGYNPAGRELDDATVADALVCVDSRRATLAPFPSGSNDLLAPISTGILSADRVSELGEIIGGSRPGRDRDDQITLYKSVGVAEEDATATALVLAAAREHGVGSRITL
ncbi:MAG TPA: ornithine cyclodeaminase family protein [Micromonosporaceae bacterium]